VLREVSAHTLFVRMHGLRLAPKLEITKRSKTFAQIPLNKIEKSNRVLEGLGSVAGTGAVEMADARAHRYLHAPPPCAASTRRRCAPPEEAGESRARAKGEAAVPDLSWSAAEICQRAPVLRSLGRGV
jgi:hypothetical protein